MILVLFTVSAAGGLAECHRSCYLCVLLDVLRLCELSMPCSRAGLRSKFQVRIISFVILQKCFLLMHQNQSSLKG